MQNCCGVGEPVLNCYLSLNISFERAQVRRTDLGFLSYILFLRLPGPAGTL
jgi:hypothetical protein